MTEAGSPVGIKLTGKLLNATIWITSLGYLVDMFDFLLFNILRSPSLIELGLSSTALTDAGLFIANFQMGGILAGAYVWGVLGDKFGRKSTLFASILVYSLASLGCSFVQDVNSYAALRFLAGFGVAGELGVGVALIAERLDQGRRGIGVTFFICMGFVGVLLAALTAELLHWRTAYLVGGIAGLVLMAVRGMVMESSLYEAVARQKVRRGGLRLIFTDWSRLRRYLAAIFLAAPGVFAPQILWTLSPELAAAHGIAEPIKAGTILAVGFFGSILADMITIVLSERLRSRKRAAAIMLGSSIAGFILYFLVPLQTKTDFIIMNGLLGLTIGCWVMGIVLAAEQFGTNVRSTVATTVPNFARGLAILMNLSFMQLKMVSPVFSAAVIGAVVFALAIWGWYQLQETYGKDLDYVER